jgi:hypothetical protein
VSYKDRKGESREAAKWYIEVRVEGVARRLPGFVDKDASEQLGRALDTLRDRAAAGLNPTPELSRVLEGLDENALRRLSEWGLVERERVSSLKPLAEHIEDYGKVLEARGDTPGHVAMTAARISRLLELMKVERARDLRASRVVVALKQLREADRVGAVTSNHYLRAAKGFTRWMWNERRLPDDPLAGVKPLRADADLRWERRAL